MRCNADGSVDVAAITPGDAQRLMRFGANRVDDDLVHRRGHALQAAADQDGGAVVQPLPQYIAVRG